MRALRAWREQAARPFTYIMPRCGKYIRRYYPEMKTCRKTLSLVMVFALVMSLFCASASADFTDQSSITNDEAAVVLTALGVIDGFEDGSFKPDTVLTREQAAAIIARMLLGSNADLDKVLTKIADAANDLDPEIVSIYYGEDVQGDAAQHAADLLGERLPMADVNVVNGGQPVYYYMISFE